MDLQAFERYNVEKDVAEQIKKEFDRRHGPTWHCIVGRNFGMVFPTWVCPDSLLCTLLFISSWVLL